jgi:diguanylate cyclase (GGDEF)-like protein
MKSKFSITTISGISVLIIALFLVASYYYSVLISQELKAETYSYLSEVGNQGVELVESRANSQIESLEITARMIEASGNYNQEAMLNLIRIQAQKGNYKRMGIVSPSGDIVTSDGLAYSVKDRDYFKEALAGHSVVSDTLADYSDGKKINVYATPVYNGNQVVAALVASVETKSFKELLGVSSFSNQGYSFIVKANGDTVVESLHPNSIGDFDNIFTILETAQMKDGDDLATIKQRMARSESGSYTCFYNGMERYTVYKPLNTNDWYLMTVVPATVISNQTRAIIRDTLLLIGVALTTVSLLFALILVFQNRSKKKLERIAYVDEVTGGNNWQKFKQETEVIRDRNSLRSFVLLTFDIDQFRFINEEYGQQTGDALLRLIMVILKANIGKNESCCRVAADHFALLCGWTTRARITQRIRNFLEILNVQKETLGIKEKVVCHFGLYVIEQNAKDLEKIREKANMARNEAKRSENNSWFFYSDEFREKIGHEKEIIDSMEWALEQGEFEMYLQPKYDLHENRYCGCEALARWNRPQKGLISPAEFIPIFEQTGFVKKLDMFMIEAACQTLKRWEEKGCPEMRISVNASRKNLIKAGFVEEVMAILNRHQVRSDCIEIELTEYCIFEDVDRMIEVGNSFRAGGVKVSMDDFGSGYSSINLLGTLPLDVIKIDQGFFRGKIKNAQTLVVVRTMIDLIKKLGMTVVAEGIETEEEVKMLKALDCDIIQGYYYGKPMTVADFETKILATMHCVSRKRKE